MCNIIEKPFTYNTLFVISMWSLSYDWYQCIYISVVCVFMHNQIIIWFQFFSVYWTDVNWRFHSFNLLSWKHPCDIWLDTRTVALHSPSKPMPSSKGKDPITRLLDYWISRCNQAWETCLMILILIQRNTPTVLTHWGWEQMPGMLQTFSNAFFVCKLLSELLIELKFIFETLNNKQVWVKIMFW